MLSCDEVTRIISRMQDEPLSFGERIRLRLHLAMCGGCRNFGRQMSFLRSAMHRLDEKMEGGSPSGGEEERAD